MRFIALIPPSKIGRAYGAGQTLCEAQSHGASSGFQLGDWVAVEITRNAYEMIITQGPEAVHLCLPPPPGRPVDSSRQQEAQGDRQA